MMKPGSDTHNLRPRMRKCILILKAKGLTGVMILTHYPTPPHPTHQDWISCKLFEGVGAFGDYGTRIHF
jgi:hypothetical protein